VQQQDVLQAAVELAKVEDRATRIAQDEQQARARLAMWIGEAAYRDFEETWPILDSGASVDGIKENLLVHPRIQALQKSISAAETGVELARQKYRPEFALDVTYGGRGGTNPDGSSRTDLIDDFHGGDGRSPVPQKPPGPGGGCTRSRIIRCDVHAG
jgi:outer membrane protein TolC